MLAPPNRVLLLLVAGIGDFVLSTPALRAIRLGFPRAHLVLLTTPQAAALAAPCPYLQEVLTFDLRLYRPEERGLGLRAWSSFRRIVCDLRSRRFDLVVDLYEVATLGGALRLWLLLAGIHARETAGRSSAGRGFIFDRQSADRPHEADAMLALAESIGCPSNGSGLGLWVPAEARASAISRLQEVGLAPGAPYAILNVGSNKPEARLPAEKATEIGRTVHRETGWPVLVTGDERERPAAELLARQIGDGARSIAGHTTLLELAAALEGASLVVTTDSGPMHMAAATGAPVVALFGPGDPTRYAPRGHPERTRILLGRVAPRDPHLWHVDITAAQVAEEIRTLLPHQPRIEA